MIDYRIIPEKALIVIVNHEKLSFDELLAFREKLHSDPQYSEDYDVVNDTTNLTLQYATEEVNRMAMSDFPPIKIAIIAPSDLSFGMSRMWETKVDMNSNAEVNVFREIEAALDWLGKNFDDIHNLIEELRKSK